MPRDENRKRDGREEARSFRMTMTTHGLVRRIITTSSSSREKETCLCATSVFASVCTYSIIGIIHTIAGSFYSISLEGGEGADTFLIQRAQQP